MVVKQLEFRGIRLDYLIDYFIELNGTQVTDTFPIKIQGNRWECFIIKEEEVNITSTFSVNAVYIIFKAETEEILETLVKNYRKKTTRIGG